MGGVLSSSPSMYPRKWLLQCTLNNGQAVVVQSNDDPTVPDIRFKFRIEKNIFQTVQFADITLYNLAVDTETEILKNCYMVQVFAGYVNGPYGSIFQGYVFQPTRGKEDAVTTYMKLR